MRFTYLCLSFCLSVCLALCLPFATSVFFSKSFDVPNNKYYHPLKFFQKKSRNYFQLSNQKPKIDTKTLHPNSSKKWKEEYKDARSLS